MPIVFITGLGDIPMAVRAMREGAIDFLTKPVEDSALLKSVEGHSSDTARIAGRRSNKIGLTLDTRL